MKIQVLLTKEERVKLMNAANEHGLNKTLLDNGCVRMKKGDAGVVFFDTDDSGNIKIDVSSYKIDVLCSNVEDINKLLYEILE